jgi:hypothetical protein
MPTGRGDNFSVGVQVSAAGIDGALNQLQQIGTSPLIFNDQIGWTVNYYVTATDHLNPMVFIQGTRHDFPAYEFYCKQSDNTQAILLQYAPPPTYTIWTNLPNQSAIGGASDTGIPIK